MEGGCQGGAVPLRRTVQRLQTDTTRQSPGLFGSTFRGLPKEPRLDIIGAATGRQPSNPHTTTPAAYSRGGRFLVQFNTFCLSLANLLCFLTSIQMRIIGFLGIALLATINLIFLAMAVQRWDWRGIVAMLFMAGLLVFFGHVLRRGAKLEKRADCGEALVERWAGQPVGLFFKEQVAKSIEGRVLIAGSIACVLVAMLSLLAPSTLALTQQRAGTIATLFAMWPVLAFVGYVKVCGPKYVTSVFSVLATFALVAAPFVIAYT